jgi:hypothetical protein
MKIERHRLEFPEGINFTIALQAHLWLRHLHEVHVTIVETHGLAGAGACAIKGDCRAVIRLVGSFSLAVAYEARGHGRDHI